MIDEIPLIPGNDYYVTFFNIADEKSYQIIGRFTSQRDKVLVFYDYRLADYQIISIEQIQSISPKKKRAFGE